MVMQTIIFQIEKNNFELEYSNLTESFLLWELLPNNKLKLIGIISPYELIRKFEA